MAVPKNMKFSFTRNVAVLTAVTLLSVVGQVEAAVVRAKSVLLTDVRSAVDSARDGDTVIVPPGTASWTSTFTITKGITLQGAGNERTVILDNIRRSGAVQTVVRIRLTPTQSFRLSGFTFRPGSLTTSGSYGVYVEGKCPSVRIDHCHFAKLYRAQYVRTVGWLYGVIDHCVFDCRAQLQSILIFHDGWGDKTDGDGSWAEPPYFGSEKFIFIEDNIINNAAGPTQVTASIDGWAGSRYVCRYNTFNDTVATNHGLESTRRRRGCRVTEIYHNTFNFPRLPPVSGLCRSGTMLVYDNIWTSNPSGGKALKCFRQTHAFQPWGGANGNNPWDSNDPHGRYATGKHGGANRSRTLVVPNAGWRPNQWVDYSLTNTVTGFFSFITSNTSDTIAYAYDSTLGTPLTFNYGDGFAIYKLLAALDQPGRGQGDLISGGDDFPVNTATNLASWAHQALEPIYSWNNTYNGIWLNVSAGLTPYPTIKENRDFYNHTPKPGYRPYIYPHPLVSGTPYTPRMP
jgi:hypothetical protein